MRSKCRITLWSTVCHEWVVIMVFIKLTGWKKHHTLFFKIRTHLATCVLPVWILWLLVSVVGLDTCHSAPGQLWLHCIFPTSACESLNVAQSVLDWIKCYTYYNNLECKLICMAWQKYNVWKYVGDGMKISIQTNSKTVFDFSWHIIYCRIWHRLCNI